MSRLSGALVVVLGLMVSRNDCSNKSQTAPRRGACNETTSVAKAAPRIVTKRWYANIGLDILAEHN